MDDIDRKILRHLQRDANIPIEDLGEQVGLSRNATWRRIKNLEENGILLGRIARVNPDKINKGLTVFIHVRTHDHSTEWATQFARATRSMPEITGVFRMSGDLDYLIRAQDSDVKGYDALYQHLNRRISLSDVNASFVMEHIKDTTELPL